MGLYWRALPILNFLKVGLHSKVGLYSRQYGNWLQSFSCLFYYICTTIIHTIPACNADGFDACCLPVCAFCLEAIRSLLSLYKQRKPRLWFLLICRNLLYEKVVLYCVKFIMVTKTSYIFITFCRWYIFQL